MSANPLLTRVSHFAPKAERCIFIFLEGGPSQMDLFDPKPLQNQYDGQPLPDSIVGASWLILNHTARRSFSV